MRPSGARAPRGPVNGSRGGEGVVEVRRAYEYTLDRVGTDIGAPSAASPAGTPSCTPGIHRCPGAGAPMSLSSLSRLRGTARPRGVPAPQRRAGAVRGRAPHSPGSSSRMGRMRLPGSAVLRVVRAARPPLLIPPETLRPRAAGAGPLWQEFIAYLQAPRSGTPAFQALFGGGPAGQEDAQRTTLLRCRPPRGWATRGA
jgi:hypothetical protein